MSFKDRHEAGLRLAEQLGPLRSESPVVVALPRGGVPVAYEIAQTLEAPLEVFMVRKIGAPQNPEYGIGALAEDGTLILNQEELKRLGVGEDWLEETIAREQSAITKRVERYRGGRPIQPLKNRTVILVDDGLATGLSDRAAITALRKMEPKQIVLAVPVGPIETIQELSAEVDKVICLEIPVLFGGVGAWYEDFAQVSDKEVISNLDLSASGTAPTEVLIEHCGVSLTGDLTLPEEPRGLVLFAHGSGSSRKSARNRAVAHKLERAGFGTLLLDLLSEQEAGDRTNVFDISLLSARLIGATCWAQGQLDIGHLDIGYFGASTEAAAALVAAADLQKTVRAVVSRGGRPDIAQEWLSLVHSPTLLIVGSADTQVLELNRQAMSAMSCQAELTVVPEASHLFQEPGTLETVAQLASDWFTRFLGQPEWQSPTYQPGDRVSGD